MYIRVLFNFVRRFDQNCTGSNSGDIRQTVSRSDDRFGLKTSSGKLCFPRNRRQDGSPCLAAAKKGEYEKFVDPIRFAEKLTADLQSISRNRYLRLRYSEQILG